MRRGSGRAGNSNREGAGLKGFVGFKGGGECFELLSNLLLFLLCLVLGGQWISAMAMMMFVITITY